MLANRWKRLVVGAAFFISGLASAAEIYLYAGAGLRHTVETIIHQFENRTGHKVVVEYGGSGQILTRFNLTKAGDLFLPGAADYAEKLQQQSQVVASYPLVLDTPALVVRKDTGKDVKSIEDLANSSLRLGVGDPKAIALGRSGEVLMNASGFGPRLKSKITTQTTTIKQRLIYLLNGDIDAAIIGRSDAVKHQDVLFILPSPEGTPEEVATIAILKTSTRPEALLALKGQPDILQLDKFMFISYMNNNALLRQRSDLCVVAVPPPYAVQIRYGLCVMKAAEAGANLLVDFIVSAPGQRHLKNRGFQLPDGL